MLPTNTPLVAALALVFTLGYFIGHRRFLLLSSESDPETDYKSFSDIDDDRVVTDRHHVSSRQQSVHQPIATTAQSTAESAVDYDRLLAELLHAIKRLGSITSTFTSTSIPQHAQQHQQTSNDNFNVDKLDILHLQNTYPSNPFQQQQQQQQQQDMPVDAIQLFANSERTSVEDNTAHIQEMIKEQCSTELAPVCCQLRESVHAVLNYCMCVSAGGSFVAPDSSCSSLQRRVA